MPNGPIPADPLGDPPYRQAPPSAQQVAYDMLQRLDRIERKVDALVTCVGQIVEHLNNQRAPVIPHEAGEALRGLIGLPPTKRRKR